MEPQEPVEGKTRPGNGETRPDDGEARPGEARSDQARPGETREEDARLELAMLETEVEVVEKAQQKKRFESNPVTRTRMQKWAATHPELYDSDHSGYYIKEANDKAVMYLGPTGMFLFVIQR